jgi:hypothetical protein
MAQLVQVIAEQKNQNGAYVHVDTEYFSDAEAIKDWMSGAVEWADRFRIFDNREGYSNFFYEGLVVNGVIPKWEKKSLIDSKILNVYA